MYKKEAELLSTENNGDVILSLRLRSPNVVFSKQLAIKAVLNITAGLCVSQGFMQDKIIASHTCFGGHMDVNC